VVPTPRKDIRGIIRGGVGGKERQEAWSVGLLVHLQNQKGRGGRFWRANKRLMSGES